MKKFLLLSLFLLFNSFGIFSDVKSRNIFVFSDGGPPFSYSTNINTPLGITPDLVSLLSSSLNSTSFTMKALPWPRAQKLIELGSADCFATYPSKTRKRYATFTKSPLYYQEYGYIIFSRNNPRVETLRNIGSIKDLDKFIFVSQQGVAWEDDNIPLSVKREYVNSLEQLLHVTLNRESGDFFIMNLEQALFYAKKFKYIDRLDYIKVDFIPNSTVAIHVGVRKNHPNSEKMITEFDRVINTEIFKAERANIINRYKKLMR